MKKLIFVAGATLLMVACNTKQTAEKAALTTAKDSLITRLQQRDSTIMAYISSYNDIQKNIDTLMHEAHMLKVHGEKIKDTGNVMAELKTIGTLIIKNQRELNDMQRRLKKSSEQNQGLTDLGEELAKQINEKDSEIATIQKELVSTRSSLASVVKQFNDSLTVIIQQRAQIGVMQIQGNKVYYIVGTEKELMKDGVILKNGGVIGIGKAPSVNANMSTQGFISGDMPSLHEIDLKGHFVKMVTPHPSDAYKITTGSPDKIIITDPQDFWSKSKYLVVIIK